MPKSRRPRKAMGRPLYARDLDRFRGTVVDSSHIHAIGSDTPRASVRMLTPRRLATGAAGAAVLGGGAIAVHRSRRSTVSSTTVTKLYNPFTDETVEVGKTDIPPTGLEWRQARRHDGRFGVGHALDVKVVRRGKRRTKGDHDLLHIGHRRKSVKAAALSKADQPKASAGRKAAGTIFPVYHGAIAGKGAKNKAKAAGSQWAHAAAGGYPGAILATRGLASGNMKATAAGLGLSTLGLHAGSYHSTIASQRKGRFKPEKVGKAVTVGSVKAFGRSTRTQLKSSKAGRSLNANLGVRSFQRAAGAAPGTPYAEQMLATAGRNRKRQAGLGVAALGGGVTAAGVHKAAPQPFVARMPGVTRRGARVSA